MAILKATPESEREVGLTGRMKLPKERYAVRILEEEFKISNNSGNPMIVLVGEIVAPDSFKDPVTGATVNIHGTELDDFYLVLSDVKDAKKAQANFNRYADTRKRVGNPVPEEGIDVDNPPTDVFKGLILDCICDSEEQMQRKDPTPEQKAKKEMGDPLLDAQGKKMMYYRHKIKEILGLADPSIGGKSPY